MGREPSRVRLAHSLRDVVCGTRLADANLAAIAKALGKPDGTKFSQQSIWHSVQLCEGHGGVKWDGVVETGG